MASEQEMMADLATADAAGDTELAQHIAGQIKAARGTPAEEPPGMLRKALTWAGTPSKAMQPIIEQNKASNRGGMVGPDSSDTMAGAARFVSGMPGFDSHSTTPGFDERMSRYDSEHPVKSVALGMMGGLASPVLPSAMKALPEAQPSMLRSLAESTLKPTPEAALLRSRGVPLTVGQLNPRSAVGQVEEASTSLRGVGASIAAQREAGKKGWQQLVMGEAHPPGMPQVPPDWKLHDALSAIYEGFKPSYEALGNELIYPAIHGEGGGPLQSLGKQAGAMERAALDPSVLAPDQTRQAVNGFLQHQLTILPQREGAVGKVGMGDLLQARSNIRDAAREAVKAQDFATARLLHNGEDAITRAVESQASPQMADALRQTDAKYRAYKVVEDAVSRAGDSPSGFSPSQLGASLKASMGKGQFARGGGGDLRELSRAGKTVFESVSPPTGARLLTVGPLGEFGTGPLSFLANRPPVPPTSWMEPETRAGAAVGLRATLEALRKERERRGTPVAGSQYLAGGTE